MRPVERSGRRRHDTYRHPAQMAAENCCTQLSQPGLFGVLRKETVDGRLSDPQAVSPNMLHELDNGSMLDEDFAIEVAEKAVLAVASPPYWEPDNQTDREQSISKGH